MSLPATIYVAVVATPDAPAFPPLSIGDPSAGHAGNAQLRDFIGQIVAKLWTLVTDNLTVIIPLVMAYVALEFGESLYGWVKSGFGKWDKDGQGSLFK